MWVSLPTRQWPQGPWWGGWGWAGGQHQAKLRLSLGEEKRGGDLTYSIKKIYTISFTLLSLRESTNPSNETSARAQLIVALTDSDTLVKQAPLGPACVCGPDPRLLLVHQPQRASSHPAMLLLLLFLCCCWFFIFYLFFFWSYTKRFL